MVKLALVITVRMSSARFPGKVLASICGQPALYWIYERLRRFGWRTRGVDARIVVSTSTDSSDDSIVEWCRRYAVAVYRGSLDNVFDRVGEAGVGADYIVRVPGDCLMINPEFILRSVQVMSAFGADGFMWYEPRDVLPVYGCREFPWSSRAWELAENLTPFQQEHVDMWFRENLSLLKIIYHSPPESLFYRPYRLELDTREDLVFFNHLFRRLFRPPSVREAIMLLDANPELAALDRGEMKTGPFISYSAEVRDSWYKRMLGAPVVAWDDSAVTLGDVEGEPVFCSRGHCIGYAREVGGRMCLARSDGTVIGEGEVVCIHCGERRIWMADRRGA